MKVVMVSRDSRDLWKHEYIREYVLHKNTSTDISIICGEMNPSLWEKKGGVIYIYKDFAAFRKKASIFNDADIAKLQSEQSDYVYGNVYKADRRYLLKCETERLLAIEQLYLVEKAKEILQEYNPDFLFMTGGGNLIRNTFYMVGQGLGIGCYRILNVTYLNPRREGVRYWFSSNNYCRISQEDRNKFGYSKIEVAKHAHALVSAIQSEEYKLDNYARTIAGKRRASIELRTFLIDLAKYTVKTIVRNDPMRKNRLKSAVNFFCNQKLTVKPSDIREPFFLFPLNVPDDAQLVLRAPQFQDILSICEQIANVLPYGYSLVIKEHPGHPGMLDHDRLALTLKHFPNILYLAGNVRVRDVLSSCSALITINSTTALEALVNNIPVITLGEAYYRGTGLTYDVEYLMDLNNIFTIAFRDPLKEKRKEKIIETISSLLQETVPAPSVIEPVTDENCLRVIAQGILKKLAA